MSSIFEVTFSRSFFLSLVFQTCFYLAICSYYKQKLTIKQRGWILTALNSAVFSVGSLPFVYNFVSFNDVGPLREAPLMQWDGPAKVLCGFFVAYLVCDLILGTLLYPSEMSPTSGYFHHTLYILLTTHLLHNHLHAPLCIMGILELPTLVLSLTNLHPFPPPAPTPIPALKTAKLTKTTKRSLPLHHHPIFFAVTFFTTRIAFHAWFVVAVWRGLEGWSWVYPAGVLPLHVAWFWGWCKGRGGVRKRRRVRVRMNTTRHIMNCRINNESHISNSLKSPKATSAVAPAS